MKRNILIKFPFVIFLLHFLIMPLHAQIHRGAITALIHNGDEIISAGEDGFITIWNTEQRIATSRFQLTTYKIEELIHHPVNNEICIIEASGINNYRISVWNYRQEEKLFSVYSGEPVTYINYSAGGSFLIASGLNGSDLILLESSTGNIISAPDIPEGSVTLAITGRAERNMLIFQSEYEGQILYLDLDTGDITDSFTTVHNLTNPIIFGSNRFLAGVNSSGLHLVNAATGEILDSARNIERNALLVPGDDGFYCLSRQGARTTLYFFNIDRNGRLVRRQEHPVSPNAQDHISRFAHNGSAVFGTAQGNLLLLGSQNRIINFTYNQQTLITNIEAGHKNIAVLTEGGSLCFIPLDYRALSGSLHLFDRSGFTHIAHLSQNPDFQDDDEFVLWQITNTRPSPLFINTAEPQRAQSYDFLPGRFPLRSVSSQNGKVLFLDTAGNLTLRDMENMTAAAQFSFSAIGSLDAAIVDASYFVLCRSVLSNNTPFLFVNYRTGETVPVPFPARAGLAVYAGSGGYIYAETVEREDTGNRTTVVSFSTTTSPVRVFEYRGEASHLSVAESSGTIAICGGSEGAFILADDPLYFERTNGLPVKLIGCNDFFLSLDSEGNIAWHDPSGKILAVLSFYADRWILRGDSVISGSLSR